MEMVGKRSEVSNGLLEAGKWAIIDNEDQHIYLTCSLKDEQRKREKTRYQFGGGGGIFKEKVYVRGVLWIKPLAPGPSRVCGAVLRQGHGMKSGW